MTLIFDFNATLTAKNAAELYMIKPAIRLAKSWNAASGYIYDAYSLEKYIVGLSFYGVLNLRDYLFTIFDNLDLSHGQAQWRKDKLARAKEIVAKVRQLERDDMPYTAEGEVKKLIPE